MAGTYSVGFQSVAAGAGAAYAALRAGASLRPRLRELGLFVNAATASSVGLIRASNTPVATTSKAGQPEDPADPASTVNLDTAWSTAPTIGAIFLRQLTIPATIGNGIIWTWPADKALVIAVSASLVIWNFGAGSGSVLNGYAILEE